MRIATFNVNSITSRLTRVLAFLERAKPDVLCLQELKCVDEKFPLEALTAAGYHASVFGQKTYNGVAVLTREKPLAFTKGFEDPVDDPAARFLWVELKNVSVASAYIPNGQAVGSDKYVYKLQWLERLKRIVDAKVTLKKPFVIAGDFNVAPEDRDCHDPQAWEGQILFSEPEKKAFRELCAVGLTDTFRIHHKEGGKFSWWDYRNLSFPFNKGMRIDFILANESMRKVCTAASIDRDERKGEKPSDHAPVIADFDL